MKTLQQHINEKLVISKNTNKEITWDSFVDALLNHNDGTLELEEDNIEIFVNPPSHFSKTSLIGRVKGCQITRMRAYEHKHNEYYISINIDSDFLSGNTIQNFNELKEILGEEQIEKIYYAIL